MLIKMLLKIKYDKNKAYAATILPKPYFINSLKGFIINGKWRTTSRKVGKLIFTYNIDERTNRLFLTVIKKGSCSFPRPTSWIVDNYIYES